MDSEEAHESSKENVSKEKSLPVDDEWKDTPSKPESPVSKPSSKGTISRLTP
jgi:hypothetical protein